MRHERAVVFGAGSLIDEPRSWLQRHPWIVDLGRVIEAGGANVFERLLGLPVSGPDLTLPLAAGEQPGAR